MQPVLPLFFLLRRGKVAEEGDSERRRKAIQMWYCWALHPPPGCRAERGDTPIHKMGSQELADRGTRLLCALSTRLWVGVCCGKAFEAEGTARKEAQKQSSDLCIHFVLPLLFC